MAKVDASKWKWFGHAGHFICGTHCRFHLCTQVGKYLISTVGEYWPERGSREIHAKYEDPKWLSENVCRKGDDFDAAFRNRFGYLEIGCDRLYETMVFRAGTPCASKKCGCGLPEINGSDLDYAPANEAGVARANHLKLCKKFASK